jgi:hypothetical protein
MAIFLEKSGVAADVLSGFGTMGWDTGLATGMWYPLGLTGAWYVNTPGVYDGWFTDVTADKYYAAMTEELIADGITAGCEPGTPYLNLKFCPETIVDRSQMAVFLFSAWGHAAGAPATLFGHTPAPWWWDGPVPAVQN